jgi:YVTN family beta-propeller protein
MTSLFAAGAQAGLHADIPNDQSGTVSVIDATSGILIATVAVGDGPNSAVLSPDKTRAYVGNSGSQSISVIDTVTHAVRQTIALGASPMNGLAISPDSARLYVPLLNANLAVVDTTSGAVVASVPVGANPYNAVVSLDGAVVYVPCYGSDRVDVVDTATRTVTGSIAIVTPYGAALTPDGSRLYVASSNANTVAVVDTATNTVTASVPVGSHPVGVASSMSVWIEKVYVTNSFDNTVSVIDTGDNTVVATVGVGEGPAGIAAMPGGNRVLVLNHASDTVTVIGEPLLVTVLDTLAGFNHPSSLGSFIGITAAVTPRFETAWGTHGAGDGQFSSPTGVAIDTSGNAYVADFGNRRVQKFDANGAFLARWGSAGSGDGQFNGPVAVAVDGLGHVYVADSGNNRIQKFDPNGGFLAKWGSSGSGDGQFNGPCAVAVDGLGDVYVAECGNHRIQKFDAGGAFLTKWGSLGSGDGEFDIPIAVAVDAAGNVYVADWNTSWCWVQKFDSGGTFLTRWRSRGPQPRGIAVGVSGDVFVSDGMDTDVTQFTSEGVFVTVWGGYGNAEGQLRSPRGVAADASGAVYVADSYSDRIQKFAYPADVGVTFTDVPAFVNASDGFFFQVDVANAGPAPAAGVTLTLNLPAGVTLDAAEPAQGSCAEAGGVVTCDLGDMAAAEDVAVLVIAGAPAKAGAITVGASVASTPWDNVAANNTASDQIIVNGAPTDIALGPGSVEENQPAGASVGTFTTTDPNSADPAGESFTYELVAGDGDADNALFAIAGNELQTAAAFDYETRNSYSVRVSVTDQGFLTYEKSFTIAVTDVNEAPTDIALSSNTVAENLLLECPECAWVPETGDAFTYRLVSGSVCVCNVSITTIGYFSTADPDTGDTFTYALVAGSGDTDNVSFEIVGDRLSPTVVFNYEFQSSYSIRVRSTDQDGLWTEQAFTITVTDVNEAPTDIALDPASVAENQPPGTVVGTFSTTDPDAGDTFTYTLVPGTGATDNASFAISAGALQTAAVFDFELRSTYSVRVRSTDEGGLSTEKAFTITVTDANDAPTAIALSSHIVDEGRAAGTVAGTLSTTDVDPGDTFTYTLVDDAGHPDNVLFGIDGNQLVTAATLDFSVQSVFRVLVRSTDLGGLWVEQEFTITPPSYVLWTRADTGRAVIWKVDPAAAAGSPRVIPLDAGNVTSLASTAGVGKPWQATSFAYVNATTAYVLWTRADTGRAVLWQIDPGAAAGSPKVIPLDAGNVASLASTAGVGGPWQATSFAYVDATKAYVLWTRADTGRAVLWQIDPGAAAGSPKVIPLDAGNVASLASTAGIGRPWQATSFAYADATTAYVLWTRADTGRAVLWQVDPGAAAGSPKVIPVAGGNVTSLSSATGVGAPWVATGFVPGATIGVRP